MREPTKWCLWTLFSWAMTMASWLLMRNLHLPEKGRVGNPGGHGGAISIHHTDWHPSWADAGGRAGWTGVAVCLCDGISLGLAGHALAWNSLSLAFKDLTKG